MLLTSIRFIKFCLICFKETYICCVSSSSLKKIHLSVYWLLYCNSATMTPLSFSLYLSTGRLRGIHGRKDTEAWECNGCSEWADAKEARRAQSTKRGDDRETWEAGQWCVMFLRVYWDYWECVCVCRGGLLNKVYKVEDHVRIITFWNGLQGWYQTNNFWDYQNKFIEGLLRIFL